MLRFPLAFPLVVATLVTACGSSSDSGGGFQDTAGSGGTGSPSAGGNGSGNTSSAGGNGGGNTSSAGGSGAGTTSSAGGNGTGNTSSAGGNTSSTGGASVGAGGAGSLVTYGSPYDGGQYNLGPVDYSESQFHDACAPGTKYDARVQAAEGTLLAGLWNGIPNVAQYCDACIWVVTDMGKSAMLRVVTYGDTSNNSIDVSPDAYQILNNNEYPRGMTWQLAECPQTGPMMYEFQTGSNQWWTSLWVRNARVPLAKVEVQSANHADWVELDRGGDGTLTDASGFGMGSFSIRSTGVDGQVVTENFTWPDAGIAGAFLDGQGNFN